MVMSFMSWSCHGYGHVVYDDLVIPIPYIGSFRDGVENCSRW